MITGSEVPGFIVYKDTFSPLIQFLSPSELGKLITAMYTYCDTGADPDVKGKVAFAWGTVKPRMDRDMERYTSKVETSKYAVYCREQKKAGLVPLPRESWLAGEYRPISDDNGNYPNKDINTDKDKDINTNSNSNKDINIPAAGPQAPSAEPGVEDVKEYCEKRGYYGMDPEAFVSHYRARDWMVGNAPMRDWRAMADAWEKKARDKAPGTSQSPSSARALEQMERLDRLRREMRGEAIGE